MWVSNLNEEQMKGNDADDHRPPIVKLPQAINMPNYYQIYASFRVFSYKCDEHAIFYE